MRFAVSHRAYFLAPPFSEYFFFFSILCMRRRVSCVLIHDDDDAFIRTRTLSTLCVDTKLDVAESSRALFEIWQLIV